MKISLISNIFEVFEFSRIIDDVEEVSLSTTRATIHPQFHQEMDGWKIISVCKNSTSECVHGREIELQSA
jgi:hypothetical protein